MLHAQHDLLLKLGKVRDLQETLRLCLETALQVSGMECGGIYLTDKAGNLLLAESNGLSETFVESVRFYPPNSEHSRLVATGMKLYTRFPDLKVPMSEVEKREGLRALAVLPIQDEQRIIGCINVASRTMDKVPWKYRIALQTIASLVGLYISRAQSDQALRESEGRLQLFIEHAPAALAMFDCQMRYLAVSRRWIEDYGLAERNIVGQSLYDVFPDMTEQWKSVHRRAMAGEIIVADEDTFERSDGTIQWLRWEVRPWHTGDGLVGGIVIFAENITERKALERAIIEVSTAEQERIGHDIHDGLGQQLTGLAMLAGSLQQRLIASGNVAEAQEVAQLRSHLQFALEDTRALARGLSPVEIDPEGLADALDELAARSKRISGIECRYQGEPAVKVHNSIVAMHLYRIAQEAVCNALKHAQPGRIEISLNKDQESLALMIVDNGKGIDPGPYRSGLGLHIMRYRAGIIGGQLKIGPHKDGGTVVECKVPLADSQKVMLQPSAQLPLQRYCAAVEGEGVS